MSDCGPVAVAKAMKDALITSMRADEFSMRFDVRAGIVYEERLPDMMKTPLPLVDIVLPVKPQLDLSGTPRYLHIMPITFGVRQRLTPAHFRDDDQSIDLDKIAPLLNLYYELVLWAFPSSDNLQGIRTGTTTRAVFAPPAEIVYLYEPDLLETAKLYCGIFRGNFHFTQGDA